MHCLYRVKNIHTGAREGLQSLYFPAYMPCIWMSGSFTCDAITIEFFGTDYSVLSCQIFNHHNPVDEALATKVKGCFRIVRIFVNE